MPTNTLLDADIAVKSTPHSIHEISDSMIPVT